MMASMTPNETDTIAVIKKYLISKIPELKNMKIVIIHISEDNMHKILDDAIKLSHFEPKKEIELIAIPQICPVVIKTADSYNQRNIDVTSTVYQILFDMIPEKPDHYIAGFIKPEAESPILNVCALSLPLCLQDWFHDTLIVVRRLYVEETAGDQDDEKLCSTLLDNAKLAIKFCISGYTADVYAQLSALQFRIEQVQNITESYIRQNISRCVSPIAKELHEDAIVEKTIIYIRKYYKLDKLSATRFYLVTAINDGEQCSLVEKVRAKVSTDMFSKTRYLYISRTKLALYKDGGITPAKEMLIDGVQKVDVDDAGLLTIEFANGVVWSLKSDRPQVIFSFINETIRKPFEKSPDRATITGATLQRVNSFDVFKESMTKTLAVVAPIVKADASQQPPSSPHSFDQHSSLSGIPSTFVLNEEQGIQRVQSLKMSPPGLPVVLPTASFEAYTPVSVRKESARSISINAKLDINREVPIEYSPPSVKDFFEYGGLEPFSSNKSLFLMFVGIYILIALLKWKICN